MFDLDSSSVVRFLIGLFVFRCKVSRLVVRSLIGLFVFRSNPVSSLMRWWNLGSSFIDGEFENEQ